MQVKSIDLGSFRRALKAGILAIQTGPLTFKIRTPLADVARSIHLLYAEHPAIMAPAFTDFHVELGLPVNLRRYFRPQVHFAIDGEYPFQPLPRDQAPALLEWGLNWSVAAGCHQWLTLHAASLERNGLAVILPAPPGTGKSTLCAALSLREWRLLSDELSLLDHDTLLAHALARPISLKNESIELIRGFERQTRWAPTVYDTHKGLVTHMAPPKNSVERMQENAQPRWVVFPKFVAGAAPQLVPKPKAETFIELAKNSFNYSVLGETGFDIVRRLIDQCECYSFTYSRLEDAVQVFEELASRADA